MYWALSVFIVGVQIENWNAALSFYQRVGYITILIELCLLSFFIIRGKLSL